MGRNTKAMGLKGTAVVFLGLGFLLAIGTTGYADLVGHWEFKEGSGVSIADSSNLGNDGEIVGDVLWRQLSDTNWCLDFRGSTGTVEIADSTSLNPDEVTISAWVSPKQALWAIVAGKGRQEFSGYHLATEWETILALVHDTGDNDYYETSNVMLTLDQWQHIAFTYNKNEIAIYLNGELDRTIETAGNPIAPSDAPFVIGARSDVPEWDEEPGERFDHFDGLIDEVRVYNVALSAAEIKNLYETTTVSWAPGYQPPNPIEDLRAELTEDEKIKLLWTAPGNEGTSGTALKYEVRYGTHVGVSWDTATEYVQFWTPLAAGTTEEKVLADFVLEPNVYAYYFQIKTCNTTEVWSDLSNRARISKFKGKVAHWKFDEGSESTFSDSSGFNNNGTLHDNVIWNRLSETNYCLQIDHGYGLVPNSGTLDLLEGTVMAWICPTSFDGDETICVCHKGCAGWAPTSWQLGMSMDLGVAGDLATEGGWYGTWTEATEEEVYNKWAHIALSYSMEEKKVALYRNGEEVWSAETDGSPMASTRSPVTIGGSEYYGNLWQYFIGYIDEVSIYNVPYSSSDIKARYDSEKATVGWVFGYKRPAPIWDLRARMAGPGEVELTWTAPGDDGMEGAITAPGHYDIRYSSWQTDWEKIPEANRITDMIPASPGTKESKTISVDPKNFFWIKTVDGQGIWSEKSNIDTPVKGTVLLMHFDEGSGMPQDSSGWGNNPSTWTARWITTTTWRTAVGGEETCLDFVRSDEPGIYLPPRMSLKSFVDGVTLKCWINQRTAADTPDRRVIMRGETDMSPRLLGGVASPWFRVGLMKAGRVPDLLGTESYSLNEWHFLAATYDRKVAKVYIDGKVVGEVEKVIDEDDFITFPLDTYYTIGNCSWESRPFDGFIDEVEIKNCAMSEDEIWMEYAKAVDKIAPKQITDLTVKQVRVTTLAAIKVAEVSLSWTAPGDDGTIGMAVKYVIKYSRLGITEDTWDAAKVYDQSWVPKESGEEENYSLLGFDCGEIKYYFALKAIDDKGNISLLSNVVEVITPEKPIPLKPDEEKITCENGELAGTSGSVEAGYTVKVYVMDPEKYPDAEPVYTATAGADGSFPTIKVGSDYRDLWIVSVDPEGITSPSCYFVNPAAIPEETKLLPSRPNPFKPGHSPAEVILPYELKEDVDSVTIKIFTAAGELVKTLENMPNTAGKYLTGYEGNVWDGTNEDGDEVVSGIYIYTIEAGGYTKVRKLLLIR